MRKYELQLELERAKAEIKRLRAMDREPVRSPCVGAAEIRRVCAEHPEQESFVVVALDSRQRVLYARVTALGSLAHVDVHPREVFRDAVRASAHSIVIGHNHPSGDPEPSAADRDLTRRMAAAGQLIGIPVLDHVIVTKLDHYSFAAYHPQCLEVGS